MTTSSTAPGLARRMWHQLEDPAADQVQPLTRISRDRPAPAVLRFPLGCRLLITLRSAGTPLAFA
jgi:hypothetical protein